MEEIEKAVNSYNKSFGYSYSAEEVLEAYDQKYKRQCYVPFTMKDVIENCVIPFEKGTYVDPGIKYLALSIYYLRLARKNIAGLGGIEARLKEVHAKLIEPPQTETN